MRIQLEVIIVRFKRPDSVSFTVPSLCLRRHGVHLFGGQIEVPFD
jgi:hypothetical protein